MARDLMQYGQMVEDSLRGVVRMALRRVATDGLLGEHHFYIGFKTQAPGVDIPAHLRAQYPEEMTIVIQHKFWGLEVREDDFEITLSFGGQGQRLFVPFQALTSFLDPSVQFGLQFGKQDDKALDEVGLDGDSANAPPPAGPATTPAATADADEISAAENRKWAPAEDSDAPKPSDNIITLDKFRKD
ncbi:MAG: hypothetical protein ISR50_20700 [Alphaproteobacteria bacterium]|nr:hypothetical protein [Alphaproteobacteria bacterium]